MRDTNRSHPWHTNMHHHILHEQGHTVLGDLPTVVHNTHIVHNRIRSASQDRSGNAHHEVRLVAVSKTKPVQDILDLYEHGHRHFGENYMQELIEKAQVLPKDINWHFIGHLQSSKANKLIKEVPNLFIVETVDSEKLAMKLQAACESVNREQLNIFVQVDTSGEETKSGVSTEELLPLADFIRDRCPRLKLCGLMTIGAAGDSQCFDALARARTALCSHWSVDEQSLELSMGMSMDFEEAIAKGASSVRVGSTIFGERIYPNKTSNLSTNDQR